MGAAAPALAALPILGGVVGAYGAGISAQAQQNYYGFQAQSAADESALVGQTASEQEGATTTAASEQSAASARAANAAEGAAKSTAAANGNVSAVNQQTIQQTDMTKEALDQSAIRYNADMANFSTGRNALYSQWNLMNQESEDEYAGQVAGATGGINEATSLLGGASQTAGNFGKYYGS